MSEVAPRNSIAAIEDVSASVNWHCAEVNFLSPFARKCISLVVRGMKGRFRRPVTPRLLFLQSHIRRFMDIGCCPNSSKQ
jgi:hypothetical protein